MLKRIIQNYKELRERHRLLRERKDQSYDWSFLQLIWYVYIWRTYDLRICEDRGEVYAIFIIEKHSPKVLVIKALLLNLENITNGCIDIDIIKQNFDLLMDTYALLDYKRINIRVREDNVKAIALFEDIFNFKENKLHIMNNMIFNINDYYLLTRELS
jgi:hypothetical protein